MIAVVLVAGCIGLPRRDRAASVAAREVRVAHDYGLGGPGPLLSVTVMPGEQPRGVVFVRAPRLPAGRPDSIAVRFGAEQEAAFARVGCTEPVAMDHTLACRARLLGPDPDWGDLLGVLDSTLVADSAAERSQVLAERAIVQADSTIRLRGCLDCGGVRAEIHQGGGQRRWRLGPKAAATVSALIDSLLARVSPRNR